MPTEVKRYRKKPVEVEAVQWTGENREEVDAVVGRAFDPRFVAVPGDWIILDPDLGVTSLSPKDFEATYEEVDDEA
jgi:hypothetical protein